MSQLMSLSPFAPTGFLQLKDRKLAKAARGFFALLESSQAATSNLRGDWNLVLINPP